MNRRVVRKYTDESGGSEFSVQSAAGDWHVDFIPDPDGDIAKVFAARSEPRAHYPSLGGRTPQHESRPCTPSAHERNNRLSPTRTRHRVAFFRPS